MSSPVSRRSFLGRTAAGGLGIALAGSVEAIAGPAAFAAGRSPAGYGPLVPDPAGVLALPAGFSYRIVAESGVTLLESGEPTPSDPDGTACFSRPGGHPGGRTGGAVTLVNNHEVGSDEPYRVPVLPGLTYDPGAGGGTTNIDVDARGARIREYVSLAGTHNNCAGGKTPWNTWLTCEETEQRAGGAFQRDHGYVFEVDPFDRRANQDPVPLRFLGRYAHEAVAVDPRTSAVYLTEDATAPHGLLYRWTPPDGFRGGKGALRALASAAGGATAGTLEAMTCHRDGGGHVADLCEATEPGTRYRVRWTPVPDRDAREQSVRVQLPDERVTRSRKLEGAWWGDGGAYVVASFARHDDGSANEHDGQVWFYDPRSRTITLKVLFGVNPTPDQEGPFDGPDNISVSPYGGIIVAEDGEGLQHLVGVTDRGETYPIARNEMGGGEFTGPTFGPDPGRGARFLFACVQSPGHVFAITGPWRRDERE
ncbi:alkaline phosphatase PhoX [Nonomuraea sp. NPDC050783]|uniref:alkaline phosphatase PhoX n=1 Tax=Nonomuraea sp. NPDC050783 TaxID=3154634 RepID=UPI0034660896